MKNVAQQPERVPPAKHPLVTFALSVFLLAAGYIVWPGCATAPLPSKRSPMSSFGPNPEQIAALGERSPFREEVERQTGKPDEYFADVRVACYPLNHLNRKRLVLFLGIIPAGTFQDVPGAEVAMIQYDEQGRMQGAAIRKQYPYSGTFRHSVQKWVGRRAGFKEIR